MLTNDDIQNLIKAQKEVFATKDDLPGDYAPATPATSSDISPPTPSLPVRTSLSPKRSTRETADATNARSTFKLFAYSTASYSTHGPESSKYAFSIQPYEPHHGPG